MAKFLSNEDGLPEAAGVLEVEHDGQWVYSSRPQPDPTWSATDSNGHEHSYSDGADHYPSLRLEHGEPYWCAECNDEHTDSWYVCRLCGEKVAPGTRFDPNPTWVAGPPVYRLDGEEIPPEQARAIQERYAQSRS
ncbi:hypothetical protein [Streptomyces sp. KR2]|uniref:hypothetical protein n=1 Tax=Streptomyces sp. KR2 TaxID=1514824 RepID=UPI003F7ECBDD